MLMYHWSVEKDIIERHADSKWENKSAVIDFSNSDNDDFLAMKASIL